jgi:hypothetical protein
MKLAAKSTFRRSLAMAVSAVSLLTASGCATLNENECRTVDWQTVGYEDGGRGQAAERIGQHRKACAKYGIKADLAAYQNGREAGLREYCRPANGFRVGAAGRSYGGVCADDLEAAFLDAYEAGHRLHELRAQVSDVEARIGSKQGELEHAEDELAKTSAAIISSDSTPERRAQALLDTKHLAEDVGRLKAEIESLQAELVQCREDVTQYRATVRYAE